MASSVSYARSWDELQKIAEQEYVGKKTLSYYYSGEWKTITLQKSVSRITLNNVDNPIVTIVGGIVAAFRVGDDDIVEIFLENDLETINCYFIKARESHSYPTHLSACK